MAFLVKALFRWNVFSKNADISEAFIGWFLHSYQFVDDQDFRFVQHQLLMKDTSDIKLKNVQ